MGFHLHKEQLNLNQHIHIFPYRHHYHYSHYLYYLHHWIPDCHYYHLIPNHHHIPNLQDFQNNPWLPIFDFDPADLADYWSMRSPNNPINYNENKIMAKQELSDRINMVFQNMQQVLEYKYLDDNVSEEEFLVILDYLLDNQASPITECDCTKINRPKDYNAGCLAAEVGWLNGVKKMAENIVKNESIDTVKREFSKWRDNARMFDREWSMGGFSGKSDHEIRAQRCREVAEYLQSLI